MNIGINIGTSVINVATRQFSGPLELGQSFLHESNFLMSFVSTELPSAGSNIISFRHETFNNYWTLDMSSTGVFTLYEYISNSPNSRGTSVITDDDRVRVTAVDELIKIYINNILVITRATASTSKNGTTGLIESLGTGGIISDLATFPFNG